MYPTILIFNIPLVLYDLPLINPWALEGTNIKKNIITFHIFFCGIKIIKNNAKQNYFYGSQYYLEKEENWTFNVYEPKEILSWNDVLYSLKSN